MVVSQEGADGRRLTSKKEMVAMKRMMIRYRVKQGLAGENQQYIERVFAELRANSPQGIRYISFRERDGDGFVHLVSVEAETGENPLEQLPAFKAFQATVRDRCETQPVSITLDEVGSYRVFDS
jgi:hypothetical protein